MKQYQFISPNGDVRPINTGLEIEEGGKVSLVFYEVTPGKKKEDATQKELVRVTRQCGSYDGFHDEILRQVQWNLGKIKKDVEAHEADIKALFPAVSSSNAAPTEDQLLGTYSSEQLMEIAAKKAELERKAAEANVQEGAEVHQEDEQPAAEV